MRRGESGEAQDKVFKRYEFSAKGKFWGAYVFGARRWIFCAFSVVR